MLRSFFGCALHYLAAQMQSRTAEFVGGKMHETRYAALALLRTGDVNGFTVVLTCIHRKRPDDLHLE